MSGDTSAVVVSLALTAPFPFAGDETLTCGANEVIADAAIGLLHKLAQRLGYTRT